PVRPSVPPFSVFILRIRTALRPHTHPPLTGPRQRALTRGDPARNESPFMHVNATNIAARRRPPEAARLRRPPRARARAELRGELTEVVRRASLGAAEQVSGAGGL